jgi:hypothetical protein
MSRSKRNGDDACERGAIIADQLAVPKLVAPRQRHQPGGVATAGGARETIRSA